MMKRIIVLFLMLCLLCGCAAPSGQMPETTEAPVPESTAVTEPTESLATVPENVDLEAVNAHAFCKATEIPEVAVVDHRSAAFLTTEYPDKDYSRKNTRIRMMDLYADIQTAETLLEGTYGFLLRCGATGYLAVANAQTQEVIILDAGLNQIRTFQPESSGGVLSSDLESYYYIRGGALRVQNTVTGEAESLQIQYSLDFHEVLDFDPEENILLVSAYSGAYSAQLSYCALDLDTGEVLLLRGSVTGASLTEHGVLLEDYFTGLRYSDVYYCSWDQTQLNELPGFLVTNLDFAGWAVSGTDYTCRVTYEPSQKVDIVDFQLFRLGETVSVCSLQEQFAGAKVTRMYALPDGNLLAMETNRRGYRTYLICTDQLEFADIDLERAQGDALIDPELTGEFSLEDPWEIPQELEQVRQKADALEEEYGITILISGQCTQAAAASGMDITTTDRAGFDDEAQSIALSLRTLETVLKMYPKDFFRQFRDEAGEKGLLVLLVEKFSAELNVIGVSYRLGQWYPIAVDITSGTVASTLCHEIWHATELRISDVSESALDLFAWAECNPEGFGYSGNMTPSYIEDTRYTFFMGDPGEGVYFVDPYGKVNGKEDRARLMEYIMCTDDYAAQMMRHPALREKLQILCEAIRKTFDTSQWDNVRWERFFR